MADIEIKCDACNTVLDGNFVAIGPCISVSPCETCAEKEKGKGYDEGYDVGHVDGYEESIMDAKLK